MTLALLAAVAVLCGVLVPVCFVQLLYLESLRLLARELPALNHFKAKLEEQLGLREERGALAFSLLKHFLLATCAVLLFAALHRPERRLWESAIEALLLSWALIVVFAQVTPHLLYRKTSAGWVRYALPLLRPMVLLVKPLLISLEFLRSLATLNEEHREEEAADTQAKELEALIEAGAEEGLIEEDERKLIESVVAFSDKTVREVMTPRPNIVAISQEATLEELRELAINERYSRMPVYGESIDDVTGFVHVRDMFEKDYPLRAGTLVKEVARPIKFVPETKPVDDLLREMQKEGAHMAIVVDEYGNTAGVVTMEDLVEEIVGEIRDEYEPDQDVQRDGDGSYVVSGSFDLGRLEEMLDFQPAREPESTTIGGLVSEWLGRVPQPGEAIEQDGIHVEVLAGNQRRVSQVRIRRLEPGTNANGNG